TPTGVAPIRTGAHRPLTRPHSLAGAVRVERTCGLADLDQMAVRVADVAADLVLVLLGRREELSPARAPFGVHGLDIRHADVEKATDAIGVGGRLERDGWLVIRRTAADIDDDPAVGERDKRRLAGPHGLAAEHVRIEVT